MNKPTYKQKRWHFTRHKRQAKYKARRTRPFATVLLHFPSAQLTARVVKAEPLPVVMCFDRNPEATLAAIVSIRSVLSRPAKGRRAGPSPHHRRCAAKVYPVRYKAFETIEEITPATALVLAAEYERFKEVHRGGEIFAANVEAWQDSVYQTLLDIGFFEIVGFSGLRNPTLDTDAAFHVLAMKSGHSTNPETVASMMGELKALFPQQEADSDGSLHHLYGAMIEAIGNVVHHAYPSHTSLGPVSYKYPHISRWWITGAVDKEARAMTAVVYDQGITIPRSLPNWSRYDGVLGRLRLLAAHLPGTTPLNDPTFDGHAISAAVKEAVSSTEQPGRGTGLAQMRDFVYGCRGGYLRIMSGYGEVIFRRGLEPEVNSHAASVGGTLIEWSVLV